MQEEIRQLVDTVQGLQSRLAELERNQSSRGIQELLNTNQRQQRQIDELQRAISGFVRSDNYYFSKHLIMADGLRIKGNSGTGVRILDRAADKLSFWGKVPVDQPDTIATVTVTGAAEDGSARSAINSIISRLQELGLIAS